MAISYKVLYLSLFFWSFSGADPGFQVRWGALKKNAPSGGRRENFGVFRVKNHDFTPKNHIVSNFRGGGGAGSAPAPDSIVRPSTYNLVITPLISSNFSLYTTNLRKKLLAGGLA